MNALPIDYEQCCADQLNPQPKADIDAITPIKPQTNNKEAANRGGLFIQSAGGV